MISAFKISSAVKLFHFWAMLSLGCWATLFAQGEGGDAIGYKLPEIRHSTFSKNLGLMRMEREDIANQLAGFVANELAQKVVDGDRFSIHLAEKLLGLALHLNPRNRIAVATNFQLAQGIVPHHVPVDYQPATLSDLFLKRSELLEKQEGEENAYLAATLLFAAMETNPKNSEAVFRYPMQRREGLNIDWGRLLQNGG